MEEEKKFKQISDITEYVKEGIKTGKLPVDEVAKFARIQARQGKVGEEIVTKMANGLEETINVVKLDEKTGNPGWVVTNPDGEQYIIEDSTFQKKYEIDPEDPSVYKPKGLPVLASQVNEDIEFDAPWGEKMKIEAGGHLILNGPGDIYGIQKAEFEGTYASTGKDKFDSLTEAIVLLDMTKEDFIQAQKGMREREALEKEQKNNPSAPSEPS